jgi:hypothetical protein
MKSKCLFEKECNGCGDYISHPSDIEKGLCHWCQSNSHLLFHLTEELRR